MTNDVKQTEWPPACTAMTPGRNKRGPACYLATFKWRGRPPARAPPQHRMPTPLHSSSVCPSVGQGVLHFLPSSPPPFPPVEFGGRGVRGERGRGRQCRCVPGGIRRIGRRRRGWRDLGGLEQSERGNGYPRSAHSSNKGMPLTGGRWADGLTGRVTDRVGELRVGLSVGLGGGGRGRSFAEPNLS